MTVSADLAGFASGGLVGFVLGLIGGGGSILAVPLLVYGVGVPSAHVAIGTSAVAVAVSAAANLAGHARAGNVKWPCALVFAAAGVAGATLGSQLGKAVDGASPNFSRWAALRDSLLGRWQEVGRGRCGPSSRPADAPAPQQAATRRAAGI